MFSRFNTIRVSLRQTDRQTDRQTELPQQVPRFLVTSGDKKKLKAI